MSTPIQSFTVDKDQFTFEVDVYFDYVYYSIYICIRNNASESIVSKKLLTERALKKILAGLDNLFDTYVKMKSKKSHLREMNVLM